MSDGYYSNAETYFNLPDGPRCLKCRVDLDPEPRTGNRCDYLCNDCCTCERCTERREEEA